jgi:hypothetical protein
MVTGAGNARSQQPAQGSIVKQPAAASGKLDAAAYQRIEDLRAELALSIDDLAALGLNSISAKSVLSTVKDFALANSKSLDSSQSILTQTKRDLQNINRLLDSGRRDETLVALAKSRHQELIHAQMQRNFVVGELVEKIDALLTPQQQSMWAVARSNDVLASQTGMSAPGAFRFAPDMTSSQMQMLGTTGEDDFGAVAGGEQVLSASQRAQVDIARQNQRIQAAAVASAESQELLGPRPVNHPLRPRSDSPGGK